MDTLAFIPRAVKKREPTGSSKKYSPPTTTRTQVSPIAMASSEGQAHLQVDMRPPKPGKGARPAKTGPDQDQVDLWELAALVCLALSDYALWSDSDLRRKIDSGRCLDERNGAHVDGEDEIQMEEDAAGYIPLIYMLQSSSVFCLSNPIYRAYPPTLYVKALRTHASEVVDVRLVLSSGSGPSSWSRGTASMLSGSGYEVRRRPEAGVSRKCQLYGKLDWERCTIYMENIPPTYRSITGITHMISNLLPSSSTDQMFKLLQGIAFLPHHKDKAGDLPVCKGFALVTLARMDDVELLLDAWPWHRPSLTGAVPKESDASEKRRSDSTLLANEEARPKLINEARRFGLRMLRQKSWEGLTAEYLLYRQRLVEEINQFQDETQSRPVVHVSETTQKRKESATPLEDRKKLASTTSKLDINDPYPHGCLVFMRNLHSETNKTTLRSLFNRLCAVSGDTAQLDESVSVDYVDYNKGMDNCFLRLRTPAHASHLVHQVNSQHLSQLSGLDAEGTGEVSPMNPIPFLQGELVLGMREELYWNKVPERIRRQAVERTITLASARTSVIANERQSSQGDGRVVMSAEARYPANCLVFVRNVHIGTNKTTLRTLFTHLSCSIPSQTPTAEQESGIDYVDYSKGTDTCHLRLCTPEHAARLIARINSSGIVQPSGLDATVETVRGPSVVAELVTGKREELYWERLPEKIRKQAAEKVISFSRESQPPSDLKRKRA